MTLADIRHRRIAIAVGFALVAASAVAVGVFLALRPSPSPLAWSDRSETLWVGIPARIRFALPSDRAATGPALLDAAYAEIRRAGDAANAFDASSETGRYNREGGLRPFAPSAEMDTLLRLSEAAWRATDGAFDPTVWPLKSLWRLAVKEGVPPAPDDLRSARARVGLARLVRDPDGALLPLDPPASLDFGGIVKGYAVDRAVGVLREGGAAAGLVQVGGEIRAFGDSPDGRPWRVGVQDPVSPSGVQGVVEASGDVAVSTSGNYEQPVRIGGRDYYHIFDPRTGDPVDTQVLGVTVVLEGGEFPNAAADALATGLTVLGPDRGLLLVESMPGAGVLFLVRGADGRAGEKVSSRMVGRYRTGAGRLDGSPR